MVVVGPMVREGVVGGCMWWCGEVLGGEEKLVMVWGVVGEDEMRRSVVADYLVWM